MENIVKSFARSLGNGIAMGEQLKAAIDHVIKERDTTVIVKLINAAPRSSRDRPARGWRPHKKLPP